jgi:hypothetical protein
MVLYPPKTQAFLKENNIIISALQGLENYQFDYYEIWLIIIPFIIMRIGL